MPCWSIPLNLTPRGKGTCARINPWKRLPIAENISMCAMPCMFYLSMVFIMSGFVIRLAWLAVPGSLFK